ncbi:UNVERIFIED_CONTAM: hypothetical protein Slati_0928000 [Sesamum latifolium]|uniref:Reverse transcriptase Ty1/copia-type domain-containing protein n=1 Tax=Sesamum latifolium TaxID=2727402 RepID=A0AAW2XQI4_9LAMI
MCASMDNDEPATYEELVTSLNENEWITAMKEEMSSWLRTMFGSWLMFQLGVRPLGTMDVNITFLNGELDEEISMDQSEGFQEMGQKCKVCHLKRFIYGLKQSSRQWYTIDFIELSIGFTMVEEGHRVYVKRSEKYILILSLFMDDILLAGNNMEMIVATQK